MGAIPRIIQGKPCLYQDLGCDDLDKASRNRERIARGDNVMGYQWVEAIVRGWPHNKPLPYWIPQGDLPKVGKSRDKREELRDYGFKIVENKYEKWLLTRTKKEHK